MPPTRTLLLPLLLALTAGAQETTLLVRLARPTSLLIQGLANAGLPVLPPGDEWPEGVHLLVPPGEEARLQGFTRDYEILDRGRPLRERLAGLDAPPDARYYTPAELLALLQQLEAAHPGLAKVVDLTTYTGTAPTHEGRHLHALKISDRAAVDEDEPNVLLAAQHHAREVNTAVMAVEAARRLLQGYAADPALQALVDGNEIWVVPMVNPDGVEYVWTKDNYWRKNRRNNGGGAYGVDLNRNYPFRWLACGASTTPGSDTYAGPAAGSEPCVQTLMALGERRHFERILDFHSYGQQVLFTYSPCTTAIPQPVRQCLDGAIAALRQAAGYTTRLPSASGEHPEWQWSARGSLSLLVEVMKSFQPSYDDTLKEEQTRIWPLVQAWFALPVPMTGTVRDLGGRPLAADLAVSGVGFAYGERLRSGGPFGRYALWVAPGSYQVEFTAPGYLPLKIQAVLAPGATLRRDVVLEPLPAVLARVGDGKLGTTCPFTLAAPRDAGRPYFIGAALGTSPGQAVGARVLPLNGDALFLASLTLYTVFVGNLGYLDGGGQGRLDFQIPAWPPLAGLRIWFAGFTVDEAYPLGVRSISNAADVVLAP